jgi:hypothetical protein
VSGEPSNYLVVLGDSRALHWVLSTRQMAFPDKRGREARLVRAEDRLLLYTTRGCFGNPTRDMGRIIAPATAASGAQHDEDPVRFGERSFPWRFGLHLDRLTPFRSGVVLADHVERLHAFPKKSAWSVYLRRPVLVLDDHDFALLSELLTPELTDRETALKGYPG